MSNSQVNFHLHRFTKSENIAEILGGGLLFLTHTVQQVSFVFAHVALSAAIN